MEVEPNDALDAEAMAIRSSVRRALFGDETPAKIGRFDVVRCLGRGGMGIVYEAYDPQLDRRLAVKVMRVPAFDVEADPQRAQRLLREAQATAKLSHPNVVTVFEVGSIENSVYMAMEFIDGQTLRQWLKHRTRTWQDVVGVFIKAGRGLVHAHGAGLVHRDFKPDNVMIDTEARVRVVDFGLARLTGFEISIDSAVTQSGSSPPGVLTETGVVLGTPAYMAPEQRRSRTAVAASDQYSFCVSLFEALVGERPPHPDDTDEPIDLSVVRGPRALHRVLQQGLQADPIDRFASMAHLVDALERLTAPRRTAMVAGGIGAAALIGVAAWALSGTLGVGSEELTLPCLEFDAQAETVWNQPRRTALASHFEGMSRGFASDAWPRIETEVDERIAAWVETSTENCEATRVHRRQPEDVRLWRSLCLQGQLRRLDALLAVFGNADAATVAQAIPSLAALDDIALCNADRAGRSQVVWPSDPEVLAQLHELEVALSTAAAQRETLRFDEGIAEAKQVAEAATHVEFSPLVSRALRVRADLELAAGRSAAAESALTSAIEQAEAGHDDEGAAEAWISLVHVVGEQRARLDEAKRMFGVVQGTLTRAGSPDHLRSRWLITKAGIHDLAGEFDESVALFEQALAIGEASHGTEHASLIRPLHGLARALRNRGDITQSLVPARRAQAIAQKHFGPRHPEVARQWTALGAAYGALGRHDESAEQFGRALELLEDALGSEHELVGVAHHNLGGAHMQARRIDEAVPHFERAIAIDRVTLGEQHPHRVPALYGLAMVHLSRGDHDPAERLFTEGLDILERAWGPTHPDLSYTLMGLGGVAIGRGNNDEAIGYFERVLGLLTPALGAEHPRLVAAHEGIGKARVAQGDHRRALDAYEAALVIAELGRNEPVEAAGVRLGVAKSLVALGRDRPRAIVLAESALDDFAAAGPGFKANADEARRWLATVR